MKGFKHLKYFLLFLGRGRSGSSLCGGLISCHPNVILPHQKEIKDFIFENESCLYNLLLEAQKQKQFIWEPLRNRSEWKNVKKYGDIQVIGTKKQGTLIKSIYDFSKLRELKKKISVPIKFINTYRNPFDNIATIYNKSQKTKYIKQGINMKNLNRAINYYFKGIQMTQEVINCESTLNVQHENLVNNTREVLTEICQFLNLPLINDYLIFCESIVWKYPRQTRHLVDWSKQDILKVNKLKNNYDFLKEYKMDI